MPLCHSRVKHKIWRGKQIMRTSQGGTDGRSHGYPFETMRLEDGCGRMPVVHPVNIAVPALVCAVGDGCAWIRPCGASARLRPTAFGSDTHFETPSFTLAHTSAHTPPPPIPSLSKSLPFHSLHLVPLSRPPPLQRTLGFQQTLPNRPSSILRPSDTALNLSDQPFHRTTSGAG